MGIEDKVTDSATEIQWACQQHVHRLAVGSCLIHYTYGDHNPNATKATAEVQ